MVCGVLSDVVVDLSAQNALRALLASRKIQFRVLDFGLQRFKTYLCRDDEDVGL